MTTGSAYPAWAAVGAATQLPYAVGVDGRLIGNYNTPEAAVSAALEHVRVVAGLMSFPAVSGLLPAVRDLV